MGFNDNSKNNAEAMKDFKKHQEKKAERSTVSQQGRDREEERPTRGRNEPAQSEYASTLFSRIQSPISSVSGRLLERFIKPTKEFLEQTQETFKRYTEANCGFPVELDVILAKPSDMRIKLETLVFIATARRPGKEVETLAFYTFLQPGTSLGTQYTDTDSRRGGLSYSAVPADGYTGNFRSAAELKIRTIVPGTKVIHVGCTTVPPTFDLSVEGNARKVLDMGGTTLYYQAADMYGNSTQFALVDLIPNDDDRDDRRRGRGPEMALYSQVTFKPEEKLSVFDLPISRDLQVEVSLGYRRNRDRDQVRNAVDLEQNRTIAQLSANVDLVYTGTDYNDRGRSRSRYRSRRDESTAAIYGLALNVTDITTESEVMGFQLTALANIALLVSENTLTQALLPSADQLQYRQPRALAYEQPKDFPADEISDAPDEEEWQELCEEIIREKNIFIFLHVPEAGVHSQLLQALVDAADPQCPHSESARQLIWDELNELTNNEWEEIADPDIEFASLETRQSLNGWWKPNDVRRDLSEIGYFNLLSRFGKDHPEYLDIYSEIMDDDCDRDWANARMEELLVAYCGKGGYTITDRSNVLRINPEALKLMAEAINNSGVTIDSDGLTQTRGRRLGMSDNFATGDMRSGLFRSRRGRGGRWGR